MKKIKIKNYEWKVIETESNPDLFDVEKQELKNYGMCFYEDQTIYIWKFLTPERKRSAIIHELVHAFIDVYLDNRTQTYTEEDMAKIISTYGDDIISLTNYLTNTK